jgi:catechol 2,3-dioxygenase-like lactoylglutathione lyase family enzyme
MTHGQILGGIVTTPDLDAALLDYERRLGLHLVDQSFVPADLAASWGCPASTDARIATLQPLSGAPCFIRLVEQSLPPDFAPTRSFGWAAYELSVQDVYSWPERLTGSGFEVVGPPKPIAGLPYFVPMQVVGRGREMLYLNEVASNTPSADLPKATSPADAIFICILATPDLERTLTWLKDKLHLEEGGRYTLEYTMINKAFGLAEGSQSTIAMVQKGRLPIIEVDGYPDAATARVCVAGCLPPGNALVTLAVDRLDSLVVEFITPPQTREGALYAGRRAATVRGSAGELIELVETG